MEKIDLLDKKILSILSKNARIPFKDVAAECGVSRAAIHQRVQHLQENGVITGSGFDINPKLAGKSINGVPIFDIAQLAEQQRIYQASIAILAVPVESAQNVTNQIVDAGLKAIWNFTPSRIRTDNRIVVQNTSIYAHLALMYNRMSVNGEK